MSSFLHTDQRNAPSGKTASSPRCLRSKYVCQQKFKVSRASQRYDRSEMKTTEGKSILPRQHHTIPHLEAGLNQARNCIDNLKAELAAEKRNAKSSRDLSRLTTLNELGDTLNEFLFLISKLLHGRRRCEFWQDTVNEGGPQDPGSRISGEIFSLARSAYDPSLRANSRQHHQQYQDIADSGRMVSDRSKPSVHEPH